MSLRTPEFDRGQVLQLIRPWLKLGVDIRAVASDLDKQEPGRMLDKQYAARTGVQQVRLQPTTGFVL